MYLFMIIIHVLFPETFSLDYLLVFITNDGPFCFARVPMRMSRAPLPPFCLEGTRLGTIAIHLTKHSHPSNQALPDDPAPQPALSLLKHLLRHYLQLTLLI